jgi:hypothetical protein
MRPGDDCRTAGNDSQRNAERKGFRIAYTRTKLAVVLPGPPTFLPSELPLDDGVRSVGHTAVFCVRNQGVDASGNFG